MKTLNRLTAIALTATLATAAILPAAQAAYPERPITWIVPFPPGGSTDTPSRIVAKKMEEVLGQPIIIQNQPGASGQIGTRAATRAKPDGYTIVLTASGTLTLPPVAGKTLPYDPDKDFANIGTFVSFPMMLVGNVDLPAQTVQELVPYLRAHAARMAIGVPSTGTIAHLSAEQFLAATGTRTVVAHYQGDTAVLADLVGGSIQLAIVSPSGAPLVNSGKVRGYMVAGNKRLSTLPDVPTGQEAGLPGALLDVWYGLAAPAGTPAEAIQTLNAALRVALDDPYVQQDLDQRGFSANYSTAAILDQMLADEPETWRKLVHTNDIKFD